jgi:hypothetical protein
MNARNLFAIIIIALAGASKAAIAEGLYVGAGVGSIQIEDAGPGYSVNDFSFSSRFFIGAEVSRNLAFEGVFFASDTATQGNGLPETRADFRGIAVYATSPQTTGFVARVGLFKGNLKVDSDARTFEKKDYGFALGLGYVLDLNKRIAVRGDFDTFISDFDTLSSLTIAILFGFGG